MIDNFIPRSFGKRKRQAFVLVLAAGLCGTGASAQQNPPAANPPAANPPAPNPFRAVTDFMGLTTESGEAADFVRATHPDPDKMNYSHLTGVDKPRVPVKTPEQVEADKAELVAEREKADSRRKKLQDEKLDPVAPNKAPPATDEHF